MTNLYYVGFNGYNQCPKTKFDLPKVIGNWTCIPFQEILNVSCTHRFIIIETKEKFLAFGKVTIGEVSQVIDKPTLTECFNSCDDYLLASEDLNLWKYIYKESKWEKLKVNFATDQEEIIWKEADNKILKITFRSDISDVILLLKNGSVWLMSSECKVELLFPHDVDKGIDLVSGLEHTLILTESGCVLSFGNGR